MIPHWKYKQGVWCWHVGFDDTWKRRPWHLKLLRICTWRQGVTVYLPGLRFIVWKP